MAFLERNANRGSISTGYDVDNSCKFEPDNSESLKWTDISSYATSARKKTFSFSAWIKITELAVQRTIWATATNGYLLLQADGQLKFQQSYGGVVKTLNTNRLFRDTSAWYHIIIAVDSTQATEANRIRLYVNGVEETSLTSTTYPSQNAEAENVYENHHYLGAYGGNQIYWGGYMADVYFISDAQITPSDVGRFDDNGVWVPKAYGGISSPSYFLEFKDGSDLGTATGLDADTVTNLTAVDQATDTPTNNFCTMNQNSRTNGNIRTQEGGTRVSVDGGSGYCSMLGTMGMSSGKWYWEAKFHNDSGDTNTVFLGIAAHNDPWIPARQGGYYLGNVATGGSTGWYFVNGAVYNGGGTWTDDAGNGPGYGNILMVAYDADNTTLYFGKEGTWLNSSNPANNSNGIELSSYYWAGVHDALAAVLPAITIYQGDYMRSMNFGGYHSWDSAISSANADANGYGSFEYAPPSGFYSLCSKNLAEFG